MILQPSLFSYAPAVVVPIPIDASIVVSFSGGKDSLASLLWVLEVYPYHHIEVIYCDTGFEHVGVEDYVRGVCSALAVPLTVLRSPFDMADIVIKESRLPSQLCRFCTSALKRDVAAKYLRRFSGVVYQVFGFRREESLLRSRKSYLQQDSRLTVAGRVVLSYAPLLDWSACQVVDYIRSKGFELFRTYEYLSRLSCRVCFLSGKRDKQAVKSNDFEGWLVYQSICDSVGVSDYGL